MTTHSTLGESVVGTTLAATYQIQRVVGEGGMGTVYEALHLRLNKRVAVKVMAHALARNAEALARFRREAEVTSAIGHPHIVQVMDFAVATTGEPFFVMEFLDGEDLEHRMQRLGRLAPHTTLHIVKQVASALAAAHAKGVIHRDLKPANIYLLDVPGERDFVKVLDFGVSKVHAAATKLTAGSRLMGTPKYMSREQAQGLAEEVDDRTDQWALACIAWEGLVGRAPFLAEDDLSVLYQVVYEMPPPASPKALPPPVDRVLRKALAKNRRDRFSSITDFARAFERALAGPTVEGARGKRRHGRTLFGAGPRPLPTLRLAFPGAEPVNAAAQSWPRRLLACATAPDQLVRARRSRGKWFWAIAAVATAAVLSGASPFLQAVPAVPAERGAVPKASARPPILLPEAVTMRPTPPDAGAGIASTEHHHVLGTTLPLPATAPDNPVEGAEPRARPVLSTTRPALSRTRRPATQPIQSTKRTQPIEPPPQSTQSMEARSGAKVPSATKSAPGEAKLIREL